MTEKTIKERVDSLLEELKDSHGSSFVITEMLVKKHFEGAMK